MTENLDQLREQSTFDVAAMRGKKLAALLDRIEAAEAAVQRVREVAHYSNKAHREAILEALDGGEQE